MKTADPKGKGVSPILSTVLIVLVVIALAGTFLVYTQRTGTALTERSGTETQEFAESTRGQLQIDALRCGSEDNVTVRNLGGQSIDTGGLTVFVDGSRTVVDWNTGSIAPNEVGTSITNDVFASGETVRVVTAGGNSDSSVCS